MIRRSMIAVAMSVGMAVTAVSALADDGPTRAETRLAERLEGRVAGEPVRCITLSRVSSSQVYDRTAIVYKVGSTLYVNRPENGARSLRSGDVMVTRPTLNRLCRIDTVTMRDQFGSYSGNVFLGDFVPYRLPEDAG